VQYLRCLYVFFLFSGIVLCIKATVKASKSHLTSVTKWYDLLMTNIIVWLLGSFWLFLLLKFFGIRI